MVEMLGDDAANIISNVSNAMSDASNVVSDDASRRVETTSSNGDANLTADDDLSKIKSMVESFDYDIV